jgi:O-methyltransferase
MELQGVYREFLFNDLPTGNELRAKLMSNLMGITPSEAIYLLYYLHNALKLDGDLCEFGVAQGATSALIANEISTTAKNLWLFDSFNGLPQPSAKDILLDDIFELDSIDAYKGTMAYPIDSVITRLKAIDFPQSRMKIIPGFIEDTIKSSNLPNMVCFAFVVACQNCCNL